MFNVEALQGATSLLTNDVAAWLVVPPGMLIGLIFGTIPGLSISIGMAIFGCAIPAILMNIPGTSASVATTFDGYPMARRGEHNSALGTALVASVIGAGFSYVTLLLFIGPIANLVLKLGPSEMFLVSLWGMSLIAILQEGFFSRGLLAGVFGLSIGLIGVSDLGVFRGTFGSVYLFDGVPAIPALIGMFAASELFNLISDKYLVIDEQKRKMNLSEILAGMKKALNYPLVILRGGAIGTIIGAIPGVGSSVANLVSYASTKRQYNKDKTFGKGDQRGVIASESANSSNMVEGELLRSYQLTSGRLFSYIIDRPMTLLLLVIFLISLSVPLIRKFYEQKMLGTKKRLSK